MPTAGNITNESYLQEISYLLQPKQSLNTESVNTVEVAGYQKPQKTAMSKELKLFLQIGISLVIWILLILIIAFVVLPIIFMLSIEFQRFAMFPALRDSQNDYWNPQVYGIKGVRNLYITVDKDNDVILGVWHVLPDNIVDSLPVESYDYESTLMDENSKILMYFHGNSGNRISPIPMYTILRQFFHIIAFDYRGYGDSTPAVVSEESVVADAIEIYRWLRNKTEGKIYMWGHSLGAALASEASAKLQTENIAILGLILEAPFNNMAEEVGYHPTGKLFSWLPWFKETVVKPLKRNGFLFETDKAILKVNCPVLIMNAEDDNTVPPFLVKKLVEGARSHRNSTKQGSVIYHSFPKHLGYGHHNIYKSPKLPEYVRDFILECEEFYRYSNKGNN